MPQFLVATMCRSLANEPPAEGKAARNKKEQPPNLPPAPAKARPFPLVLLTICSLRLLVFMNSFRWQRASNPQWDKAN